MTDDTAEEDAMAELVPYESEARHLPMTADHEAHLMRVSSATISMMQRKYRDGQLEHGGNLWLKPGMMAQALDESTDLIVYLVTMREQLQALADELRGEGLTAAAVRIERLLTC